VREPGRTIWLSPEPFPAPPGDVVAVLDPAWSPRAAEPDAAATIAVRDAVGRVLETTDLIAVSSDLLDDWAEAAGIVETMTIGRTSFWFGVRLRHWLWLQERVLWALVLRDLVREHAPACIGVRSGVDPALEDVARLLAAAEGLGLAVEPQPDPETWPGAVQPAVHASSEPGPAEPGVSATGPSGAGAPAAVPARRPLHVRLYHRVRRALGVPVPPPPNTIAWLRGRYDRLAQEPQRRLLAVHTHASQVVGTGRRTRVVNAYLGGVEDRLRRTRLKPIVVDHRIRRSNPQAMASIAGRPNERVLPYDVVLLEPVEVDPADRAWTADALDRLRSIDAPVLIAGLDLGPALTAEVAGHADGWLADRHQTIERFANVLRTLRPAGLLVADEYHRQDWMEAAARTDTAVAAIQHGTINRLHRGYVHRSRPPQLHLADRTYVFGQWEHDRLVGDSVYHDDEVVIAGSPRLQQADGSRWLRNRERVRREVRRELGIRDDDRLVVLSGTWGALHRRFHYPVVLSRLFDRTVPRVHLVVKLHPSEQDEGPYRAVIERAADAGGFAPPPISVVKDVDLYRLLTAADAHLGIHSTVLTEAVFTRTPNLLATGIAGGDLLDYVPSGVAVPVRDGADLGPALDAIAAGVITDAASEAFLAHHFRPGPAANRIADDLLAWLPA
jgi:hypothetical protein